MKSPFLTNSSKIPVKLKKVIKHSEDFDGYIDLNNDISVKMLIEKLTIAMALYEDKDFASVGITSDDELYVYEGVFETEEEVLKRLENEKEDKVRVFDIALEEIESISKEINKLDEQINVIKESLAV